MIQGWPLIKDLPAGYGIVRKNWDTHDYVLAVKPFHLLFRFVHWIEELYLRLLSFLFWRSGIVDIPEGEIFPPYILNMRNWHWPHMGRGYYLWCWTRIDGDIRLLRMYNDHCFLAWLTRKLGWRIDTSFREYEPKNPMAS